MKTLEQVIKDACAKHLSSYSLFDAEYIANDIREWQKELNKDKEELRVEIEEALINSHVAGFSDKELEIMSEAVMSILVEPVDYAVMSDANRKAQAEISHLTKEFEEVNRRYDAIEKLYASARLDLMVEQQLSEKLRADLEIALAKVERYEKRDEATAWLPSQAEEIIQLRRELLQSQNELNALKQRVKFLPGDRVWVLDSYGEIRNVFIESMSNGNYVTVNLSGNRTQFHQNSCFATAEECRAAIRIVPIEEKGE